MPFTNVLANCMEIASPLKEEALKMQKKVQLDFFSESSTVYGMLVNLKKKGRGIVNTFLWGSAKVSVALLTKFSNDLLSIKFYKKQTNYDCLIHSFQ